ERALVQQLTAQLKTPRDSLADRIADLSQQLKTAEKRIAQFEAQKLTERVPALVQSAESVGAVQLVAADLGAIGSADDVRSLAQSVRERLAGSAAVVALAGHAGGKATVIVATTPTARDAGARAGELAKRASAVLGGGGGGKDDLAQGGGPNLDLVGDALAAVREALRG
ncbi:MAG TPA: DHHA1 domain-containing protein, partial [Microcella sp.]|nr:DHHA1 domain-containing protein [Microcella sp.]